MKVNVNKLFVNVLWIYLWSWLLLPRLVIPSFVPSLHDVVGITLFSFVFWLNSYLMVSNRLNWFLRIAVFVCLIYFVDRLWYEGVSEISFLWLLFYLIGTYLIMNLVPFEIRMERNNKRIAILATSKSNVLPWINELSKAGYKVKFVTLDEGFNGKLLILETKTTDWKGEPDEVLFLSGDEDEDPIPPEDIVEVVDGLLGLDNK
jgi:hypothetical protein